MKKTNAFLFTLILTLTALFASLIPSQAASPNSAPIPKELELNTYTDVDIKGTVSAVDPEGDIVTYAVAQKPRRGTVIMEPNGSFSYIPDKGKNGKDTFTYIAADNHGNVSKSAVVTIYVRKLSSDLCYADMDGNEAHYAALCLADNGIFIGTRICGKLFFEPEKTVSRGEFLMMCLSVCGIEGMDSVSRTGFSDDSAISAWLKPYVAAGLMNGIISGYAEGDGIVFSSDKPITLAEAAVALDNAMALTDIYSGSVNDTCPAWARQSCLNLETNHVLASDSAYNEALTRSEAAKMLVSSMEILKKR